MEKLIGNIGNQLDIHNKILIKKFGQEINVKFYHRLQMEIFMTMLENFHVKMKKFCKFM